MENEILNVDLEKIKNSYNEINARLQQYKINRDNKYCKEFENNFIKMINRLGNDIIESNDNKEIKTWFIDSTYEPFNISENCIQKLKHKYEKEINFNGSDRYDQKTTIKWTGEKFLISFPIDL